MELMRFGRLRVVETAGVNHLEKRIWRCLCDCGAETIATTGALRSGTKKSCGCLKRERCAAGNVKHGGRYNKRVYTAWINMKSRCDNPSNIGYQNYGGRGIRVCERWESFANFYADMGDPPPNTSLDRRDNNGHYEPGNCRWASKAVQSRNKRANRMVTINGMTKCIMDWIRHFDLHESTVYRRMDRGWSAVDALTKRERPPRRA